MCVLISVLLRFCLGSLFRSVFVVCCCGGGFDGTGGVEVVEVVEGVVGFVVRMGTVYYGGGRTTVRSGGMCGEVCGRELSVVKSEREIATCYPVYVMTAV